MIGCEEDEKELGNRDKGNDELDEDELEELEELEEDGEELCCKADALEGGESGDFCEIGNKGSGGFGKIF